MISSEDFSTDTDIVRTQPDAEENGVLVTSHGHQRMRERLKIPPRAVDRMANNARIRGRNRTDFKGPLRKYLDFLWKKGQHMQAAEDILVYGNNVYLFAGNVLVTTWNVPKSLRKFL